MKKQIVKNFADTSLPAVARYINNQLAEFVRDGAKTAEIVSISHTCLNKGEDWYFTALVVYNVFES